MAIDNDKTIEELFRDAPDPRSITYKNKTIYGIDYFPVGLTGEIKISFEMANSKWKQGVSISGNKTTSINNVKNKEHIYWLSASNNEFILNYKSKDGIIKIFNVWKFDDGPMLYGIGNSGMIVEEIDNGRRYRCNDGQMNDDFDDLVFRIERI